MLMVATFYVSKMFPFTNESTTGLQYRPTFWQHGDGVSLAASCPDSSCTWAPRWEGYNFLASYQHSS